MEDKKIETAFANITPPASVTLAGNPNFVIFEGKQKAGQKPKRQVKGRIKITDYIYSTEREWMVASYFINRSAFTIREQASGKLHYFLAKPPLSYQMAIDWGGMIDKTDYNDKAYTFYAMESTDYTLYAMAEALKTNSFFSENFDITFETDRKGKRVAVLYQAKNFGDEYDFEFIDFDPQAIIVSKAIVIDPIKKLSLEVISTNITEAVNKIEFVDTASMTLHILEATTEPDKVSSQTFFVAKNKDNSVTAENIRACMMNNTFLKNNFHITIPTLTENGETKNGRTIYLTPKGKSPAYTFQSFDVPAFISKQEGLYQWELEDTLLEDKEVCEIQIDMYKQLGADDQGNAPSEVYTTTLSKAYSGTPLWFDTNTIWANQNSYSDSFLNAGYKWCNTGTDTSFRFTAKRFDGVNNETFYYSDTLHAVTGYGRNLESNNLLNYVYDTQTANHIKPLTRQPVLTHIKTQKQYFNFILSAPAHGEHSEADNEQHRIGIECEIYNQSGSYLGSEIIAIQGRSAFNIVNTLCIDIDTAIEKYANAGIVKAYLWHNGKAMGEPLTYNILPACLYKVNDFAFLNSLGGWSSFNFGGTEQTDFKSNATTFYRTQTPGYTISSRIESVFNKEVTEQFTVHTAPVTAEVAEWLQEVSSSIAVYELATKRYIIVEEMNVKHNSKDDLFTLQMKYHYSDSYNANVK